MNNQIVIRRSSRHEKKMRWFDENEPSLEARYPGMWVAISDGGLAGVGDSVLEAEESANANGFHDVMFALLKPREAQGMPRVRTVRPMC